MGRIEVLEWKLEVTKSFLYSIRLQLLAFLKSDWSDAWLQLLIVTRTVNSIEPASYSRNLVHMTYYSGH